MRSCGRVVASWFHVRVGTPTVSETNRESLGARVGRRVRKSANRHLLPTSERVLPRQLQPGAQGPVFILGAPRGGTTLLMQVLARCLDISYLSNRHAAWFGAPALVERFARPSLNPSTEVRSEHGRTSGAAEPSECADWWYRFFPKDPAYVERFQISAHQRSALTRSVATLRNAAGERPVVFKNLYASFRIKELTLDFPEAKFIVVSRDLVDQAHSLLETRQQVNGGFGEWWSMRPPGGDDLSSLSPAQQVIEQVVRVHAIIERDLVDCGVSDDRILRVGYEDFCAAPRSWISAMADFTSARVRPQALDALPGEFSRRREVRIPGATYEEVVQHASRY